MLDLFEIVKRYSDLGFHRTATRVEAETLDWLERELRSDGAVVSRHAYSFEKYESHVTGTSLADGVHLDALYYSAMGEYKIADAYTARLTFDEAHSVAGIEGELDRIEREAIAAGKSGAIVATGDADSDLCQINRPPQPPGFLPICLAAGSAYQHLRSGAAGIDFSAQIDSATSHNLIARLSSQVRAGPPLVVTTPISGWFSCAGERGTGLAIALSASSELARHVPVLLVMPTGHELGFLGAKRFLDQFDEPVCGVLHLGSCIADLGAHGPNGHMRAITNLPADPFERAAEAFAAKGLHLEQAADPADPACWIGESELWAPRRLPMISIAGTSPNFHTPSDIAVNATTPDLLSRMNACVVEAAKALIL